MGIDKTTHYFSIQGLLAAMAAAWAADEEDDAPVGRLAKKDMM